MTTYTRRPPAEPATENSVDTWMEDAINLAVSNVTAGGGPFGAVVIRDGVVLGQSGNRVTQLHDPTAHAEIMAIRAACADIGDFRLSGAVLVSSCEPCPMCLAAALWARVERIVFAADRHDAANAGFDDLEFYELLERPRVTWSMPVTRIRHADACRPFDTWMAFASRVDY